MDTLANKNIKWKVSPVEARACVTQLEMTLSRHNVVGGQRLTQPRDAVCPAVSSLATVTQTYMIEILFLVINFPILVSKHYTNLVKLFYF